MNMTRRLSRRGIPSWGVGVALMAGLWLWAVGAPTAQTASAKHQDEAAEEVRDGIEGLNRVMEAPEHAVPARVLANARAVGVFANVVQAAFIAGGRGGDGVITARNGGEWSVPAYFRLGGASVGLQIGGRRTDIVMVFTTQKALDALLDDRLEFGAEVKAVAGPVSAEAASAATTTSEDGLLLYSKDRGLFAGVALDGAVITPNNDVNRALYGATATEILRGSATPPPPAIVKPFLDTLTKYAARRS